MRRRLFTGLRLGLCAVFAFALLLGQSQAQTKSGNGVLAGWIKDEKTGEGLFGAAAVVRGTTNGATADFEGKFRLSLAAGTYELEVKMLGYQTKILTGVIVKAGEDRILTIFLKDQTVETKAVEIVADVRSNNEDALLKDQRANNGITSGVSAELLAKTPDRNLTESFRRISGTSIREGKYAMVRGLSERYNMGQLNGVSIPSTESDRKAFSLELFPSNLLDKIVVSKTATPDLPGDVAGGLIRIQTLDIPYSNSFQVTVAGEHHSLTTGKDFDELKRSGTDALGFDDGLRQIPTGTLSTDDNASNLNLQLKAAQSRVFNHQVVPVQRTAGPNLSGQISLGRRGKIWGKTAGLVASVNYYRTNLRNQFFSDASTFEAQQGGSTEPKESNRTSQDRYKTLSSISCVLNGSIKPSTSTKISLRNFFSQTGTNLSQFSLNQYRSRQDSVTTEYIDKKSIVSFYEQNSLISNQLTFEKFFGTEGAKLEVLIGTNALFRNTPDYSRLFYDRSGNLIDGQQNEDKFQGTFGNLPPVSFNQEFSGKFFSRLDERSYSPTVNLTLPFTVLKLKNTGRAGILYQERAREFTGRNYLYLKGSNAGSVLFQGPDSIFRDANFQPDLLTLYETTQVSDFYSAGTRLWAGYLMNETQFGSRGSKVIYGVRYESYYQEIEATEFGKKVRTTQASTVGDWFPSINLNLNPTSWFAVRMAWSKTVNRPELRELAGFTFFEPNQNVYFYGNPNLVRSKITNADLKLEFYPNDFSFISLNGFYKKFINPIEVTRGFVTTLPTFTYANRDEATSYGWELEGKYRFAPLDSLWGTRFFGGLQFFGNFSLIRSEVLYAQTNFKRPIHGQSPYVCNAGLGYSYEPWALDILMTYNRIGPRVAFLDDQNYAALIWERPRDLVDLSIGKGFGKWMFRLVAGDIFQQDLIQYIVLDRGGREADQKGLFGWISNVPRYQKGQDIPYFRFTQGRTLRFSVQWKL